MSAEKSKGILYDDADDFESASPVRSYHRTSNKQYSFEMVEPRTPDSPDSPELDPKYHGTHNAPQYFGSEIGLFSKFTGLSHIAEEHHHPHTDGRTKEEEEEGQSLKLREKNNERPGRKRSQSIENNPKNNNSIHRFAILLVIFSIQFASSIEMVYITPYFLKLRLNDWVDMTFWMIPVIIATLLTPLVSVLVRHTTYQRVVQMGFMIISLSGCFLFSYIDELVLLFGISFEKRIFALTWLGLIAFCLIDVSNEMILLTQNKIIEETLQPDEKITKQADVASALGKIFGFFFGSLQALQFAFYKVMQNNMDFSFCVAGILMAISTILIFFFHPTSSASSHEQPVGLKNLQITHFLPISNKFKNASFRMKTLIAAHFFGASNILMLSIYATSWIGQDILRGNPDRPAHSIESKLFDLGISWGSFALMLTSVVIMFTGFVVHRMTNKPNKLILKGFFIIAQLLCAIGLFDCVFMNSFTNVFLVLPLTGFAFQTFQVIPEILADMLEKREKGSVTGDYRHLLSFNLFYAQALTFVIIPFVFLMFPKKSDNLWGILVAGGGGLISAGFALFA